MKRSIFIVLFFSGAVALGSKCFSQTDHELIQNEYQRFERADADLNKAYQELLTSCDEVRKDKLIKAERAWLTFRDTEASLESDGPRGGTLERLTFNSVLANLTEERVKSLKDTFSSF
jgi:uncharacterized protein YecT (DUF1311 family)